MDTNVRTLTTEPDLDTVEGVTFDEPWLVDAWWARVAPGSQAVAA